MAAGLSRDVRVLFEARMGAGAGPEEMAGLIGCASSTVCRELGRCKDAGRCRAEAAQRHADGLARGPRVCKLEADPALAGQVKRRLELCWSPHAISADLAGGGERVCAETIYRAAYGGCALGPEAWKSLPRQQRCPMPPAAAAPAQPARWAIIGPCAADPPPHRAGPSRAAGKET